MAAASAGLDRRRPSRFPGLGGSPQRHVVPVSADHLDVGHPRAAAAVELLDELGVGVAGEGIEFMILILFPVLSLRPLLVLPGSIDSGERQVEDQRGCQDGEDCFVRRHHDGVDADADS